MCQTQTLDAASPAAGQIVKFDPVTPYEAHINKLIDLQPIKDAGLTVMVDCMWGNGAGYFPRLLAGGKTKVIEIHNQRNPIFPEMKRPEPIPPNIDVGLARPPWTTMPMCCSSPTAMPTVWDRR